MSIWIPRSTSNFESTDNSIKIDGTCYRAIQKNVSKSQAASAETYNSSGHGPLEGKYANCNVCKSAESTWAICGWNLPLAGNTSNNMPNTQLDQTSDVDLGKLLTEITERKDDLSTIIENPSANSFGTPFTQPDAADTGSDYKTWGLSSNPALQQMYALNGTAMWTMFFAFPTALGLDTFQQNSIDITPAFTKTFDWDTVPMTIKGMFTALTESAEQTQLAFTKS